jgi:hypothetical protein
MKLFIIVKSEPLINNLIVQNKKTATKKLFQYKWRHPTGPHHDSSGPPQLIIRKVRIL